MQCSKCDNSVSVTTKYCPNCGNYVYDKDRHKQANQRNKIRYKNLGTTFKWIFLLAAVIMLLSGTVVLSPIGILALGYFIHAELIGKKTNNKEESKE